MGKFGTNASPRRLRVLLLYVLPSGAADTIRDHVRAFARFSRHQIECINNLRAIVGSFGGLVRTLPRTITLADYDAVVLHYSNYLLSDIHLDGPTSRNLRDYRGLKVMFLQDEYRTIDAISGKLRDLGVHLLFTCVPESEVEKVYPEAKLPGLRKVTTLTGFVPPQLSARAVAPIADRPIHVGYRGRPTPYWLGKLGAEKWQIGDRFLREAQGSGVVLDISCREEDRIYGTAWTRFITSCRAMLGVESGSSIFDFTGELQAATENYVQANPRATFEEVHERLLKNYDGRIRLNQISPRCFEAAALRTAMVLYEGEYSGVLDAERHYIPLRKDFSNIGSVLSVVKNAEKLQALVERTFREVALNERYSYRRFIEQFDCEIEQEIGRVAPRAAYSIGTAGASLRFAVAGAIRKVRIGFTHRLALLVVAIGPPLLRFGYRTYVRLVPESVRLALRPHIRRIMFGGHK